MSRARLGQIFCALSLLLGLAGSGFAREDLPTTLVFPTFEHTWGIRKATSAHLFLFVGWKTKFSDPQGLAAVRLSVWDDSTSEDDDDELCVYGVNSGEANIIYNTSMYSIGIFGEQGRGEGQFHCPQGIAADQLGNVWVADTGNHRLVHLLNSGREIDWKGTIGSPGDGPGQFQSPNGVAFDSHGRLWVTDTGNSRIQVFDAQGRYVREIRAGLHSPQGIAIIDSEERWSYYRSTFICVVDSGGRRLTKLSPQGTLLGRASHSQTGVAGGRFGYPAIDYYGNVWVTDPESHCIHKFDRDLNFVVSYGSHGDGDGEFNSPRGLAIWRRFGQVFVTEEKGAQYYWVGVDLLDVGATHQPAGDEVDIRLLLTERAYLTVEIRDADGELVKTILDRKQEPIGRHLYRWDGRDTGGALSSPGQYTVRIIAEPTYSSYRYFEKVVEKKIRNR